MQRSSDDHSSLETEGSTLPEEAGCQPADAVDLRSVERLLASLQRPEEDPFKLPRRKGARRTDNSSAGTPLHVWALQPLPAIPGRGERSGLLAWLFLGLGLMAFACGAVMLGWSIAAGREDLWTLGIPLALGGQGAIIFGLIGLMEAAGPRQKQTAAALEEHRQRLLMIQNLALASGSGSRRAS